jgi:hypothetical protein
MVRLKMCETIKAAVKLVEQGHVRVGPQTVSDPAFLVTRCVLPAPAWALLWSRRKRRGQAAKVARMSIKFSTRWAVVSLFRVR